MSTKKVIKPSLAHIKSEVAGPSFHWLSWAMLSAILLVTFILYSPAQQHDFVNWDDQVYVEEQPLVLNKDYGQLMKSPVSLNYHPITMVSLAMQAPAKKQPLKAGNFIASNIWLHLVNTVLVFVFILALARDKWVVALGTAAIFALHPMHVESVAWVSERKDVLYSMFFLASCLAYLQWRASNAILWYIVCLLLFVLSIMSKAMAVVLPVVLILIDYWQGRDLRDSKVWLPKIPFFAFSIFFGMMAVSVQGGGDFGGLLTLQGEKSSALAATDALSLIQRFQFASYGFVTYVKMFFVPTGLSAYYPYPKDFKLDALGQLVYPLLFLGSMGGVVFLLLKEKFRLNPLSKAIVFGLGFYFVTVALVLQFLSVGTAVMADRYTYVPYIGLAFGLLYGLDFWVNPKPKLVSYTVMGSVAVFIFMLGFMTQSQVKVWKNSETLWSHALISHPDEDLILANRGNNRGKTGDISGAIIDFEKALEGGCIRVDVYEGLGNCYGVMSQQNPKESEAYAQKAIKYYKEGINLDPNNGNIRYNLGITQLQRSPVDAITSFSEALRLSPYKEATILPVLGMAYLNSGDYTSAVANIDKSIALNPDDFLNYYHKGLAYTGLNDRAQAIASFQKALQLNPNHQESLARLNGLR